MSGVLKVRTSTGPDVWQVAGSDGVLKVRTSTGPDVWQVAGSDGILKVRTSTAPNVWEPVGDVDTAVDATYFTSADRYHRAGTGAGSVPLTMAGWVYLAADLGADITFFGFKTSGSEYTTVGTQTDGTTSTWFTAPSLEIGGPNLTVGVWYYVACVYNPSGADTLYYATADTSTLTAVSTETMNTVTDAATFQVAYYYDLSDNFDGRVAQLKVWGAALTQAELETEMPLDGVARTANLWAYYSFRNGPQTVDESGNGRALTAVGAPAPTSGPAIVRTVLPAPLLAYNFAESGTTVTDRSGNGRDATMLAGTTPTDLHSGGEFVPTVANHRIKYTADSPALPTAAISITAKIRILTAVGSAGGVIWGKYRLADSSSVNLYFQGSSVNAVVRGTGVAVLASTALTNSTTYQVAVTYNGTTTILYINGVSAGTTGSATGALDMSGTGDALTWQSGDHSLDSSITFAASYVVDDVRMFNVALTAAQVAAFAATPVT